VGGGVPTERIALADGGWRESGLPPKKPYSVVGQFWFKDALSTDALLVSKPHTFAEGRTGVTLALQHTGYAGRPQGVLTVDFFLEDLSRDLASLTESGRNDAVLLGTDGLVLANAGAVRPPDLAPAATALYLDNRGEIERLAANEGLLVEADWQNVAYRLRCDASRPLPAPRSCSPCSRPTRVLFAPVREVPLYVIALTLGAVLLGLLGAVLLAARVTRPLHALSAEANRIREFDPDRPIDASAWISEISALARAMEGMRVNVRNFGRYVPKDLVRRLLEAGGAPTLGGERRELTIMFSDIAGFTAQGEDATGGADAAHLHVFRRHGGGFACPPWCDRQVHRRRDHGALERACPRFRARPKRLPRGACLPGGESGVEPGARGRRSAAAGNSLRLAHGRDGGW